MPRDIFSRLDEIDDQAVRAIASTLEIRGRHPQQVAIRQAYLDKLGDVTGQHVLDVGCGTGVVTRDLARRVGAGGHVVGTDPTPVFVEIAAQLGAQEGIANAEYRVADGSDMPFPDASFDLVAAVTVLSHVPDREAVLREMVRVCRPDGTLVIVDGDFTAIQIEHPDRDLTRRIVEAWRATTVDDPRLMRRIVPFLARAGLVAEAIDGYVHVETGTVDVSTSFIWAWTQFAIRQALAAEAITEIEGAGWVDRFREQNERGEIFGSYSFLSAIVRRPT